VVSQADVRSLPFDDESFDTVFDFGTCHHISAPVRALGEIARVLRPGGTAAFLGSARRKTSAEP
jgi:ubiquinone/menaquinone biosynthesis C-methylase UbiE